MNMWPVPGYETHSDTLFIGMPSRSSLLGLLRPPFYFLTLLSVPRLVWMHSWSCSCFVGVHSSLTSVCITVSLALSSVPGAEWLTSVPRVPEGWFWEQVLNDYIDGEDSLREGWRNQTWKLKEAPDHVLAKIIRVKSWTLVLDCKVCQ